MSPFDARSIPAWMVVASPPPPGTTCQVAAAALPPQARAKMVTSNTVFIVEIPPWGPCEMQHGPEIHLRQIAYAIPMGTGSAGSHGEVELGITLHCAKARDRCSFLC